MKSRTGFAEDFGIMLTQFRNFLETFQLNFSNSYYFGNIHVDYTSYYFSK